MNQYSQAIMTILSLVNPMICAAIFARVSAGQSRSGKLASACKASVVIGIILCLAALAGAQLLKLFGISLPAFQVAGGLVLAWMGFTMLRGNATPTSRPAATEEDEETQTQNSSADGSTLSPLILFAASPGTITGVITLSVTHSGEALPITALTAVIVVIAITWLIMVMYAQTSGAQKQGLVQDVSSRFMGLIVLAMGVQFVLTGVTAFSRIGAS